MSGTTAGVLSASRSDALAAMPRGATVEPSEQVRTDLVIRRSARPAG
ncbi:hypothetical protein ACF07S_31905 [Streptomyces sp. NPDC016640]